MLFQKELICKDCGSEVKKDECCPVCYGTERIVVETDIARWARIATIVIGGLIALVILENIFII